MKTIKFDTVARTRLQTFIDLHGLSARSFAQAHDFGARSVQGWVQGSNRPGLAAAHRIEKATGGLVKAAEWVVG